MELSLDQHGPLLHYFLEILEISNKMKIDGVVGLAFVRLVIKYRPIFTLYPRGLSSDNLYKNGILEEISLISLPVMHVVQDLI